MSYYIVHKRNPYFKQGVQIELFTDGFQECVMEQVGHRTRCVGVTGLVKPEAKVMPYCIKLLRRGFDDPKLRKKSGRFQDTDRDFDFERELANG